MTNGNNLAVYYHYYSCFIKFVEEAFIYLLENLYTYYMYIYIYILYIYICIYIYIYVYM